MEDAWSYHASVNGVSRMYGVGGSPPQHPLLAFGDLEPIPTDYPPLALYEFGALGRAYGSVTGGRFVDGFALSIAIKVFILAFDVERRMRSLRQLDEKLVMMLGELRLLHAARHAIEERRLENPGSTIDCCRWNWSMRRGACDSSQTSPRRVS